jgi:DNA-binding transcriptional regulator GbsR (MarR family)
MESPDSSLASGSSSEEGPPSPRQREVVDRFVAVWEEMASNWGINRTMARVYALLYCVEQPLNTDDIMERLQISRGSANMNLRSLVDWDLVEKTSVADSRKDHYVAETDVWQVTARIIEKREQQEIRPVKARLQLFADHLVPEGKSLDDCPEADRRFYERLQRLIELMEVFEGVSSALLPLVKSRNEALIKKLISVAQSLESEAVSPSESDVANE